jgi:hypothetical protein
MDTTSTRGEELLARSNKTQPPLTDLETTAISSYLDRLEPSKVCLFGTDKVYQSKDIGIGVKKDRAAQFQKALSLSASRHNDNKHVNLAAEHFDLQTQKEAFQFIKSDARIETNLKYPRAWIRLRGIQRTFYHYQLYGAFWLLKEERGHRRGAILADLMGLGKVSYHNHARVGRDSFTDRTQDHNFVSLHPAQLFLGRERRGHPNSP